MKVNNVFLISGSTFGFPNDAEALITVRATDIHHSDIAKAILYLPELLEAAKEAQCECTPSQRNSGHKLECWFPRLQEVLQKYKNLEYINKVT